MPNKADVYLIDSSIFIFKSYYSVPPNLLSKGGHQINAVYGFIRFLTQFIHQTKAKYIACAFDESLETSFRNEIYPEYKANRESAPDELKKQFSLCKKVVKAMGISTYSDGFYEADDLIGSLCKIYQNKKHPITIVSADKDLAQLIKNNDKWWSYGKSPPLDRNGIFDKMGVYPEQIVDFLALAGDAVDNIPGVPGIGIKTACALINHFKTLDEILKRKNEIQYLSFRGAKTCQKNIINHFDKALISKKLTQIVVDLPLENPNVKRKGLDHDKLSIIFDYLNFGPLLRRQILEIENF